MKRAILLCRVRVRKHFKPCFLRFLHTRTTSHQTIYPMPPMIISRAVTVLTRGLCTYSHRLFSERISIPALQKADTALNREIHMPWRPYCGINTVI